MKKRLPPWCKLVKHTLIDKDMDVSELATKTGLARPYLSSIINGRIYSQPAVNKVSDCLGIPEGTLPVGWWIGFKVLDEDVWEKVKSGEYPMFSIEGEAERVEVEEE